MSSLLNRAIRSLRNTALYWENPVGLSRPLWRDYSYWQLDVNMGIAVAGGVLGMISRTGIGSDYEDPTFPLNWAKAEEYELYRGGYHVLCPNQNVIRQCDTWYRVLPATDRVPRWIDLERSDNQTPSKIADQAWEMSEICLTRDGVRPGFYSRYQLVAQWLAPYWSSSMLNEHWWWFAQYTWDRIREHAGPPTRPAGLLEERVVLHQTADKKPDFPGECSGSQSVDWDRWEIGTEEEMHVWIASFWGEGAPPPPPPNPILIVPIKRVRVSSNLNIRAAEATTSTDIGTLKIQSVVPVTAMSGVWEKVTGWCNCSPSYVTVLEPDNRVLVAVDALNVRLGPGIDYQDSGEVLKGTDFTIMERAGDWGRFEGWVHGGYTTDL